MAEVYTEPTHKTRQEVADPIDKIAKIHRRRILQSKLLFYFCPQEEKSRIVVSPRVCSGIHWLIIPERQIGATVAVSDQTSDMDTAQWLYFLQK